MNIKPSVNFKITNYGNSLSGSFMLLAWNHFTDLEDNYEKISKVIINIVVNRTTQASMGLLYTRVEVKNYVTFCTSNVCSWKISL